MASGDGHVAIMNQAISMVVMAGSMEFSVRMLFRGGGRVMVIGGIVHLQGRMGPVVRMWFNRIRPLPNLFGSLVGCRQPHDRLLRFTGMMIGNVGFATEILCVSTSMCHVENVSLEKMRKKKSVCLI